jgi:type I restriction enzyme, S subunit
VTREEIAPGWVLVPLSELLIGIEAGKSFKCDERPPEHDETGVVKVSAVTWGEYQEDESKTCMDAQYINPALFVRPGDFLFSRANTIELVGACVIAKKVSLRVMLSDKILRLRFVNDAMKPWVLNFLRSRQGRMQIEALASGNQDSMRNIGQERIGQILLPLPPSAENGRIVAKLEEVLSDLDAGVAELKAARKKLTQYRQSLLKAAVEGALTAEWRMHNKPKETGAQLLERILQERRVRWKEGQLTKFKEQGKVPPSGWQDRYPEPSTPDTKNLPDLPKNWVWASLDQMLSDLRSGTAETSGREITEYPVLKSSAVRQGRIDFGALNYLRAERSGRNDNYLSIGDVLITRLSGSVEYVGCCAVVRELPASGIQYPDRIFCGKLLPTLVDFGDFLACCLQSAYARKRIEKAAKSTAGHKRISLTDLYPFPIPLPPIDEMREVLREVDDARERVERAELTVEKGSRQSVAQRKNILKAAFSGQLVPQDPNDEPASVLLERIRAERLAKAQLTTKRAVRRRA